MGTEIKTSEISDAAAWDAFVQSSGNGSVFSTSFWLEAIAPLQDGRVVRIGACQGDEIVAGVSFIEIERGGLRKAVSPILTPYCGFLYRDEHGKVTDSGSREMACAEQLIRFLERRYHYTMLVHDPAFTDIRPFSRRGWTAGVRYTCVLDISDPDEAWKKCKSRARRQVTLAEKSFTVGAGCAPATIGEIHEQTYRQKGNRPLISSLQVAAWAENIGGKGLIDVRTALDETGAVAGMQVNVPGNDTVYTLVYGTSPAFQDRGVDSFLMWEAVKQYSRTHRYLDMVGANIPSIAFFKRGFGADLKPYYVTERYSSPLAKLAFTTYATTRKLFRR